MECSDEDREDMEKSFRESLVTVLQKNGAPTEGRVGVADEGEGQVGVANKATDRYDIGLLPSIVLVETLISFQI